VTNEELAAPSIRLTNGSWNARYRERHIAEADEPLLHGHQSRASRPGIRRVNADQVDAIIVATRPRSGVSAVALRVQAELASLAGLFRSFRGMFGFVYALSSPIR